MKIYLKKGIGNIKFGMNRSEVEKIIEKPDRSIMDPEDVNELIWEYNDLKLRLTFYQNEGGRLGYIRSSNSKLTIADHKIIDKNVDEIIKLIDPNSESWEKEEYDLFTTYFNDSNWLTLNATYERVSDLELGVPFKNDEEYDWPK